MAEEQNIIETYGGYDEINPKIDALRNLEIKKIPYKGRNNEGTATSYRVFYNPDTQTVQVLPVDLNGEVVQGAESIYTNGVFDLDKMEVELSRSGQGNKIVYGPFLDEEERERINELIKDGVENYSVATGTSIPKWVTQDGFANDIESSNKEKKDINLGLVNESSSVEQSNMYANTENNNNSKTNKGLVDLGVPFGQYNNIVKKNQKGFGRDHNLSDYDDDADVMFRKIVRYPIDMADNMDHMMIQCYAYQPPYAPAFRKEFGEKVLDEKTKKKVYETNVGFGIPRQTPFKRKLGAGIKLPMPNNMMDQNPRMWDEGTMNTGSMGAVQNAKKNALTSFFTFDYFGFGGPTRRNAIALQRLKREAGRADMLANQVSQLVSNMGYDVPAEQILSRSVGVIANANTELLFSGVSLRTFEFQWQMSPRDELEAANVRMIIRAFKQWSAPRKLAKIDTGMEKNSRNTGVGQAGGPSFFLGTPNIFRLRYLTRGKEDIMGVNKFKPCALTNVSVNYTPEGQWMAYDRGMPISVVMTLSFNELEPIYNTDYTAEVQEGRKFIDSPDGGNRGDLFPISIIKQHDPANAEIGY